MGGGAGGNLKKRFPLGHSFNEASYLLMLGVVFPLLFENCEDRALLSVLDCEEQYPSIEIKHNGPQSQADTHTKRTVPELQGKQAPGIDSSGNGP